MVRTSSLSDSEGEDLSLSLELSHCHQQFKMAKHNEAVKTSIHVNSYPNVAFLSIENFCE